MRHRKSNQGSAFILVIGVMTTLAMVGTVFFLIAMGDAKMSVARSEAAPMNSVVQCELSRIKLALAADLHIEEDGSRPYTESFTAGANDIQTPPPRRWFMDYPNYNPDDPEDCHLASTERAMAECKGWYDRDPNGTHDWQQYSLDVGRWGRISNVYTKLPVTNIDPSEDTILASTYGLPPLVDAVLPLDSIPDSVPLVDADGDGVRDSFLYPTGTFDRNGDQYYAGVRVVDLSAFVNVNTADRVEDDGQSPGWMTVGMIDPSKLPVDWPNSSISGWPAGMPGMLINSRSRSIPVQPTDAAVNLETARGIDNAGARSYSDYYCDTVRMDMNAALGTPDAPFSLEDELACRWLDSAVWTSGSEFATTGAGTLRESRLARTIGYGNSQDWAYYGRYLTTVSTSRIFARPERWIDRNGDKNWDGNGAYAAGWRAWPAKVNLNTSLVDTSSRELAFKLYRRAFYQMLGDLDDSIATEAAKRRKMAAQLAVNLIDYRDGDDIPTVVDVPDASGVASTEKVMGIERMPIVSQVWVKADVPDPDDLTSAKFYMAVVLYNPYSDPISVSGWKLADSSSGIAFAKDLDVGVNPIPSGGRLILSNHTNIKCMTGGGDSYQKLLIDTGELSPNKDELTIYRPGAEWVADPPPIDDDKYVPVARITKEELGDHGFPLSYSEAADLGGPKIINLIRDTDPDKCVWAYAKFTEGPDDDCDTSTGGAESVGASYSVAFETDSYVALPVYVRGHANADGSHGDDHPLVNVAELNRIFTIGPSQDDGPIDEQFEDEHAGAFLTDLTLGRLDSCKSKAMNDKEPSLPRFCLAADLFTVESPLDDYRNPSVPGIDPVDNDGDGNPNPLSLGTEWNRETRVMGRININTATVSTLCTLPMLAFPNTEDERLKIASTLVAYRDMSKEIPDTYVTVSYDRSSSSSKPREVRLGVTNLPTQPGFVSTGEPAIVLRSKFADNSLNSYGPAYKYGGSDDDGLTTELQNDLTKWDLRYAYLSNLLAVNSDTYCAYIWIQKGSDPKAENLVRRRYVAILDRSNCFKDTDRPQVRALAEVK